MNEKGDQEFKVEIGELFEEIEPALAAGERPAFSWSACLPWLLEPPPPVVMVKFMDDFGMGLEKDRWVRKVDGEYVKPPQEFLEIFDKYSDPDRPPAPVFLRSGRELESDLLEYQATRPPDLSQHFRMPAKPESYGEFIARLRRLEAFVEEAYLAPQPAPPPSMPNYYPGKQGHLGTAPSGINAQHAWTSYQNKGGHGEDVTIAIIDYHWNARHNDLTHGQISEIPPAPAADVLALAAGGNLSLRDHGTAVLGILLASHVLAGGSEEGMRGICPRATIRLYAPYTDADPLPDTPLDPGTLRDLDVAAAIQRAVADLQAGDIILIEQQACIPEPGQVECEYDALGNLVSGLLVPVEYFINEFNAIRDATDLGIIVVEAAGNGNQDLDDPFYGDKFNRDVRDSGAILVGAGKTAGFSQRSRVSSSNYGSRLDVQGWGYGVGTLGYGTLYPPNNPSPPENDYYTDKFAQTSSASAIVAGVVAVLQSIYKKTKSASHPPTKAPHGMCQLLVDTGTPQQGAEHIGPLPNLAAAIAQLL